MNSNAQLIKTTRKIIVSPIKSSCVMLSKSPIRNRENLLNCPPADINISPKAIAVELNTPITVSAPACVLFFMYVISRAKPIENPSSPKISEPTPINAPIAIPVNAPCPNESEKNAIRFETTIVDSNPNSGVTNRTAIRALRMNSYSNNLITAPDYSTQRPKIKLNGSNDKIQYIGKCKSHLQITPDFCTC